MSNATYGSVSYSSGAASGDKYSVVSGDGDLPINYVTFYDTLRFANWLGNGQTPGSTETGAYTLLGGTPTPSNGATVARNADATVFLPSENEWFKAAYYNPATSSYYFYATSSGTAPTATGPTAAPNAANFNDAVGNLTAVGAYSGTVSPYGAYDMNGDVMQWNQASIDGSNRGVRGGSFIDSAGGLGLSNRIFLGATSEDYNYGFRVASVVSTPEPSAGVLAAIACGVMLWWRKRFK
jgi:formylglycine-generating enzyme required for sulfatase activity